MEDVVIVDAVRTAVGKMGGTLMNETPDLLAAHTLNALIDKTLIPPPEIDEIILGQAKQSADQSNLARFAALQANLPLEIPGYTVHRQCGSGLQAVNNASQQIALGLSQIVLAGGAESMSTAPYYIRGARYGLGAGNGEILDPNTESQPCSQPSIYGIKTMGETAENLANKYNISRQRQDEYAFLSQSRAKEAIEKGYFEKQIIPYKVRGQKSSFDFLVDEHPRLTSIGKLGNLKPAFIQSGTVTAGNSSGRNDGAAALLIMSKSKAISLGLNPMVKIIAQASAGVNPKEMGIGPVPATLKALKQANLTIEQIDIIELNEAFAAQTLAVIEELHLDIEKVNPNGGAIALGHPIGATGAILMTKLIYELKRTGKKYGLVTLCVAGGIGITTIVENIN